MALEPRLAVDDAAALVQALQARRGAPLEVDASGVAEIGTPCLQILLSAARSWRGDRQTFAVVEPSPGFLATIGHLGVGLDALRADGASA
jgi:chemotaxis protein CheX